MKIKSYKSLLPLLGLIFGFTCNIKAQEGSITFEDGITVAIKTETKPPMQRDAQYPVSDFATPESINGKKILHRFMTDTKNKLYFGYDIEISEVPGSEKFKVAFKPLSVKPKNIPKIDTFTDFSQSKYPDEVIVDDGDIVFFDTLENPLTKVKMSDLIKVTRHSKLMGSYFVERQPAKDFTIDDVELKLIKAEAFINNEKVGTIGGIAGSVLGFYYKNKGKFIFSLFPYKGFNLEKIGIIEDNKLSFTYNGNNYKFVSDSSIVGTGGRWNVWVLFVPDYKPRVAEPIEFSAGDINNMAKSRW